MLVLLGVAQAGCSIKVEQDERGPFSLDPDRPYTLGFGRGSGWRGLNTYTLDSSGSMLVRRLTKGATWQEARISLPAESVAEILASAREHGLLAAPRAYHDTGVRDGAQWVFWIRQGERKKSTYYNNYFTPQIEAFAGMLDQVVTDAGIDAAEWKAFKTDEGRSHEKEYWDL